MVHTDKFLKKKAIDNGLCSFVFTFQQKVTQSFKRGLSTGCQNFFRMANLSDSDLKVLEWINK